MLYVTTRSNADLYTANRALCENSGPDGGVYIPFHMSRFTPEEISAMSDQTFGQRVANVLNFLFGSKLTGWDVDFCVGRFPVRIVPLAHRMFVGETWHNLRWDTSWLADNLLKHIRPEAFTKAGWPAIAVKTAVLFGLFGDILKQIPYPVDISVPCGDLSWAVAARFSRDWGLPIGNIVISCKENAQLWTLINKGELRTALNRQETGEVCCDKMLPDNLECLIYLAGGEAEVNKYLNARSYGEIYRPGSLAYTAFSEGISVSVIGQERICSAIPNVFRTHSYLCSPDTALCYSGLLDYRAKVSTNGSALIISDRSPVLDAAMVASVMHIDEGNLKKFW